MKRDQIKGSILWQVALLFAIGVLLTGLLANLLQFYRSDSDVRARTEAFAAQTADEVMLSIREYPAYEWLLRYWYEHADEMDIEYDVDYSAGTATEEKCRQLQERYPDLQLKYADASDIEALQESDQKLYAEIVYSWVLTRVNQIKSTYQIDYVFCVLTEDPFDRQFFYFSAAEPGAVRGTGSEEAYILGKVVNVAGSQQQAMRDAGIHAVHLASAGGYVDYYASFGKMDEHTVLIGITYNLSDIRASVMSQTWNGTAFAMLFQVILSLICLSMISAFVLRPLKKIQENIRLYMNTKDSAVIQENLEEIRINNEIGRLAEDVTGLAVEMDDYLDRIKIITAERERISSEMTLAAQIQESMLPGVFPPFPDRHEFDIYASMDAAREVGGDFYDFFLIDEDHLCLAVADVSDKGIPAALFMMVSKVLLDNLAAMGRSPAEILKAANNAICENNPAEMFITVWLGIFEISTGRLTASSAGHEYPVLKAPDGRFEILKDKHGFVIGGLENMAYTEYELLLQPGSKLFLYTDGVPEATDADNQLFGMERMVEALNRDPEAAPEQILRNVRSAVDDFVAETEQSDDLTMLCMVYHGNTTDNEMDRDELQIEAEVDNLPRVLEFVDRYLEAADCPAGTQMKLNIAVEEIFVNIASYAYAPEGGKAAVRVEMTESPPAVSITFRDRGKPYNPLEKVDPDVTLSAEERKIGGLGTFMTKRFVDEMFYEYKDGQNILTLKKNL